MQQSSATPKNRDEGGVVEDCCMLSIFTSQCLLVSTVFGTVSSLHTSKINFLHFTSGFFVPVGQSTPSARVKGHHFSKPATVSLVVRHSVLG